MLCIGSSGLSIDQIHWVKHPVVRYRDHRLMAQAPVGAYRLTDGTATIIEWTPSKLPFQALPTGHFSECFRSGCSFVLGPTGRYSYSIHVVCMWLGNSPVIAQKHYALTTDEDFQRVFGLETKSTRADQELVQNQRGLEESPKWC